MTDDLHLPESTAELYELAIDETVDPYRREAAIRRLGSIGARDELTEIADGAALSPIERMLAAAKRDAIEASD
jgi:hypothetical protein